MQIDSVITIGTIIETCILVVGGLSAFITVQVTVRLLKADMKSIKEDLKKMTDVLVGLADLRGELHVLSARMTGAEIDIRELRHGDGIILPRDHQTT